MSTPDPYATPAPFAPPDSHTAPAPNPYATPAPSPYGSPAPHTAPSPYGSPAPHTAPPYAAPAPFAAPAPYPAVGGAGYGPYAGAGYGPAARPPTTSLALGALLTGLGALVVGIIVSVGVLGVIGGGIGLVLGIVALRRIRAGTALGRPQAAWGIVTSVLAMIGGTAMFVAVVPGMSDEWEAAAQGGDPGEAGGEEDPWDVGYDEGYEEGHDTGYDEGFSAGVYAGDPRPVPGDIDGVDLSAVTTVAAGEHAAVGVYDVVVTAVSTDATRVVSSAFPENPAASGRYVLATLAVTNAGAEPARPSLDLVVSYWGDDGMLYDSWSCPAWPARPVVEVGPLGPGESAEFEVCIDVPLAALDTRSVLVEDARAPAFTAIRWAG